MTDPATPTLTGKQARHLRALGHALEPVVQVGKHGLSAGLLAELDQALRAHELIKVKLGSEAPVTADELGAAAQAQLGAAMAQQIGRIVLLYRPHPDAPKIRLPRAHEPR
jgi:RNA-binding protein